jgi:23S rRNA (cytidine1920-2'-O)/16S rRNA (cytidine1409-2'-O)-methyltransferase
VSESTHRLDVELVTRGLARSRGQARELVEAGSVLLDGSSATKVSTPVSAAQDLELRSGVEGWVSRAAYKLAAALESFGPDGLSAHDKRCFDVGACTGGFTQVLLRAGAREVVALDVGHGQLADEIASDPRVVERSGINIRDARVDELGGPAQLLVADLSFISLRLVLPTLRDLVEDTGDLVLLVKPQFEVGRERLGKGGIVRAATNRAMAIEGVVGAARAVGLNGKALRSSPIRGATGNAEYLLWLTPRPGQVLTAEQVTDLAATLSTEALR